MPSSRRRRYLPFGSLTLLLPTLLLLCSTAFAQGQSSAGDEELDQAFTQKLSAKSTRDLDEVVDLCESAIEKGLDDEGEVQAKQLAASALYEHAEQLSRQILVTAGRDRRWQPLRRKALNRLKKAVEYQPNMASAWLMITKLHQLPGGDRQQAAEAVEKAVELAGDDRRQLSSALFMRAKLSHSADDDDTMLADLDQAIKIDPENIEAYQLRGEYYLRNDEPEKALADLNRWLDTKKSTLGSIAVVEQLIAMGDKFDESLQASAFKILDKAVENEPDNPATWFARAKIHTIQENIDEAINDIDEALKIKPGNDRLQRFRASLLVDADRYEEATVAIDEILEKSPDDVGMKQLRMSLLIRQSKFAQAIDQLKDIIKVAPTNRGLRRQLAALYNANDQPTKSIDVYDDLLGEVPVEAIEKVNEQQQLLLISDRSSLLQGRGNARLSTGEHAEAVNDYEEALELSYRLRDLEDELDIEQSFDIDDTTLVGVLNNFAWVLATSPKDDLRDGKRSIELATEAAELTDKKEAYILSTLAAGYAENGDFDAALTWIDKATEANAAKAAELADSDEDNSEEMARLNNEQTESLQKEKASYLTKKPWREVQDVEAKKKAEGTDEKAADDDQNSGEAPQTADKDNQPAADDAKPAKPADKPADMPEAESEPEGDSAEDEQDEPNEDSGDKDEAPEEEEEAPNKVQV